MHIVYTLTRENQAQPKSGRITDNDQTLIKLKAYYAACNKYSKEITEIQKYLPGWVPPFPAL